MDIEIWSFDRRRSEHRESALDMTNGSICGNWRWSTWSIVNSSAIFRLGR